MTIVHPIPHAWITTGGTGARNYDEFADDAEITAIIDANPDSALAVEMPHCAPDSRGRGFEACLPEAVRRLARAKAAGRYEAVADTVVLYRISGSTGSFHGMFCLVDTDQISTRADEPGLVIRNEEVFLDKVTERVALAEATGHLLSPVLLLQTGSGKDLQAALASACETAGTPVAIDVDHAGRSHEIWPLPPGPVADRLRDLAGGGELVVADGNHRSLAAQTGGLARFLAVVTTPGSVTIEAYHRLVTELPVPVSVLAERLRAAGAHVTSTDHVPGASVAPGTVQLYAAGEAHAATLPVPADASVVERLDHTLVEEIVLGTVLGLDPGDKRIRYIGGDYPASWLGEQVDSGRADLAVLIAPVNVADFVAVNLDRHKMPRKSTWFVPKARGGLVLAQVSEPA